MTHALSSLYDVAICSKLAAHVPGVLWQATPLTSCRLALSMWLASGRVDPALQSIVCEHVLRTTKAFLGEDAKRLQVSSEEDDSNVPASAMSELRVGRNLQSRRGSLGSVVCSGPVIWMRGEIVVKRGWRVWGGSPQVPNSLAAVPITSFSRSQFCLSGFQNISHTFLLWLTNPYPCKYR